MPEKEFSLCRQDHLSARASVRGITAWDTGWTQKILRVSISVILESVLLVNISVILKLLIPSLGRRSFLPMGYENVLC